jgi:hypothetical protein
MELIHKNIMVEWVDLEEGYSGDWDPDDPEDVSLLRFDVSRRKNGEWVEISDASYCTLFPKNTSETLKTKALKYIMSQIYSDASCDQSIKRLCEKLSWIEPSWVE